MINLAKTVVKQYFIFSRGERKGMIFLMAVLLLIMLYPFVFNLFVPEYPPAFSVEKIPAAAFTAISDTETGEADVSYSLFPFDPNKAADAELRKLGFSDRNIKSLRKYQSKGGRFRKPDDILKLYGLSTEHKNALLPFVVIEGNNGWLQDSAAYRKKKQARGLVELNTADSAELVGLYRIGPSTARRIVEYRTKLGGFVKADQLTELWGFDPDILYDLRDKISVDPSLARKFNLNTVTQEELKYHPYFKYKLSQAIVNYRLQHGPYRKLEDLKKIVLVSDSVYQRVILYLHIP